MKVVYILSGSHLFGGVKVVFQHARALRRLGVEATVVSPDPDRSWFPGTEEFYRRVDPLSASGVGRADFAVGTIWFTVPVAMQVEGARACHLCQCYEGLYEGVRDDWAAIEEVYRLPTLKLAVSPHLVKILEERFGGAVWWIPQPFEPETFHPPAGERPASGRLRVLLSGQWSVPIKGVEWGLRALRPLYEEGWLELVRLAQDVSEEEVALWPEAERHVGVHPVVVPDVLRGVDVVLGLSNEVEGFGLPMLEGMGCGRASVLTDIGPVRALDPHAAASLRVPFGDGEALRSALRRLRDEPALRRRLGQEGRRIAVQFTEERTGRALLEVFERATRERKT